MATTDIKYQMKCTNCNGNGKVTREFSIRILLELLDSSDGVMNKINYIKAIRAEWLLGLREAKELAEAVLRFRAEAIQAIGADVNDTAE